LASVNPTRWTKSYFDQEFQTPDPWSFFSSDYERAKYLRQIDAIRDHLEREPSNLVELGCAEGAHTALLAKAFPSVHITAIDVSTVALNRAEENLRDYSNVNLMQADASAFILDEASGSYDIIVWSEALYYLFDRFSPSGVLETASAISRRLTPRGLLCSANIIEQPNAPETPITRRPLMEFYFNAFAWALTPVRRAIYEQYKSEDKATFEYQVWVFRNT